MSFTLRIFESEFREIEDLVLKYPNIETGGDLFGLWTRDADPVVQLIIGPGQKCRRTSVSFHQDTNYLQNVGTYVNTSFMLCHIGSWHSHHQLSLNHPSAGDRSTVCNNFPRGLQRYIMIIANIECSTRSGAKSVVIHPYMFTSEGHVCKKGRVQRISSSSPFRMNGQVLSKLDQGAERHGGTSHLDLDRSTSRATSRHGRRSPTKIDYAPYPDKTSNLHPVQQRNGYHQNNEADQWYNSDEGGAKLQEIHKQLDKKVITDVSFQRNSKTFDLTLEFRHSGRMWVVEFPKLFDRESARIHSNSTQPVYSKNIVEAIEKACACSRCRQTTITPRHPSAAHDVDAGNLKDGLGGNRPRSVRRQQSRNKMSKAGEVPWCNTADGKKTLETIRRDIDSYLYTSKSEVKRPSSASGKEFSLSFTHNNDKWILEFPSKFPGNHVKLFKEQVWGQRQLKYTFERPFDALATLKQCCGCPRCRQRASSPRRNTPSASYSYSNHFAADANHSSGRRVISAKKNTAHDHKTNRAQTSRGQQQWYSNESGEKMLHRICAKISSLFLNGRQPDIIRVVSSGDICLEFDHNRNRWKIEFPRDYPGALPKIGYDRVKRYLPVQLINRNNNDVSDILRTIRSNCTCSSCQRYPSGRR